MLTHVYTGLVYIISVCHYGRRICFLHFVSIINLYTYLLALRLITILCKSDECKPVFYFCGDLNRRVTVS